MKAPQSCPECGAVWTEGRTCQDHFHKMLAWEWEDARLQEVHHLLVLSYHLQHPSLYSPEGLEGARQLLVDFLERGLTADEVRRRDRTTVDSGKRKYKIKGTPASFGAYAQPIPWTVTAPDVVAGGMEGYCDNVKRWARSILEALKTSGNR